MAEFVDLAPVQWAFLGGAVGGGIAAYWVVRTLADRILLARRPDASPSTRFAMRGAAGLAAAALVAIPLAESAALSGRLRIGLERIEGTLGVVAVAVLALALWDLAADRIGARATNLDPTADRLLVPVVRKFVRFAIWLTAALVALSLFVPNLAGVIAGLGIGGVAVALAAKDSVENVLGSITILFDRPFAIGDWVRIDKTEGIVEEINLRSTRVRTFEDTVVTLPNANLIRAAVENYGARRTRRQRLPIKFAGDASPENLAAYSEALVAWAEGRPGFVEGKTLVRLEGVSETGISVLIQTHLEADSYAEEMRLRDEILRESLHLLPAHHLHLMGAPRPEPAPEASSPIAV